MDAALVANVKIDNVAAWCRVNGGQPRTFYRHWARVAAEGRWHPRSRRLRRSPAATGEPVLAEVLRLRQVLASDNGADSILAELVELAAAQDWAPAS